MEIIGKSKQFYGFGENSSITSRGFRLAEVCWNHGISECPIFCDDRSFHPIRHCLVVAGPPSLHETKYKTTAPAAACQRQTGCGCTTSLQQHYLAPVPCYSDSLFRSQWRSFINGCGFLWSKLPRLYVSFAWGKIANPFERLNPHGLRLFSFIFYFCI